jgi:hypothetical protein
MCDERYLFIQHHPTKSSFKSPFELFLNNNLKTFGEVGVVTTKDKIQAKLSNRGTTCILNGYMEHHSRDVYRMLNLTTNSVISSLDIIWLNKTYGEWKNNKATISFAEDDTTELQTGIDKIKLTENATKETEDESNKSDKSVFRAKIYQIGRRLQSWKGNYIESS